MFDAADALAKSVLSRWMMEIVEAYAEYQPPCDVRGAVEALLVTVPPQSTIGLDCVRLTDSRALGRRKRHWSWSRGRKAPLVEVGGLYHQRSRGQPSCIELFVDQVLRGAPNWVLRFATVREILVGTVLYHELGHHLHATQRPEHGEREDVADRWARRILREHLQKRHPRVWALRPLIAFAARVVNRARGRSRGPSH